MQPKGLVWNYVLWIMLSLFILVGWNFVQAWLFPRPPRPQPTIEEVQKAAKEPEKPDVKAKEPSKEIAKQELKQPPAPKVVVPVAAGPHEEIAIGGEGFNLSGIL